MSRSGSRVVSFIVGIGCLLNADANVTYSAAEPGGDSVDENSPTAEEVLTKLLRINSVWLDPQVDRLSYVVTGSGPEREDAKSHFVSRVWLEGKNARWELESELHPPRGEARKSEYTLVIRPDEEMYLRAPHASMLKDRRPGRDLQRLRRGTTWETALHAVQRQGIPGDVRIVKRTPSDEGEVVVLAMDLGAHRMSVGLGQYHLHFGQSSRPVGQLHLHVKLPECIPVAEESVDSEDQILYSRGQLRFGEQFAPSRITYVGKVRDDERWELEARFMKIENLWLLESAVNRQDGVTVRRIILSDVSTDVIDSKLFEFPAK